MQLRSLGRLLRLSLLPSPLADVAAGLVVGSRGSWAENPALYWLFPCSLCIYHGGLVLNDWADRTEDAHTRPDRPIPAGTIGAGAALLLGCLLLAAGAAGGFLVHWRVGLGTTALALLALIYDLSARGPLLGPALLAACRATNVAIPLFGAGALYAAQPISPLALYAPALLYGAYVFSLSRVARLEDQDDPEQAAGSPQRAMMACALYLVAAPFAVGGGPPLRSRLLAAALALGGAFGLVQLARSAGRWTRAQSGAATGAALRRLLVFTSALALAAWRDDATAPIVAAAILAGYPVSWALRRVFPPT